MSKYDVEFKKLALLLLPPRIRNSVMAAYCYCLVTPIVSLHAGFMDFRKEVHYRLHHNGQTCYLRAVVNDSFDAIARRIVITDAMALGSQIIHARSVGRFKLVPSRSAGAALVLNRRGFDGTTGYDFMVLVPSELKLSSNDEKRMRALLNTYKIASKRYLIIIQ